MHVLGSKVTWNNKCIHGNYPAYAHVVHNIILRGDFAAKKMERLPCTRVISSRYHIESCCFSPNGDLLAACFGDYSVRLMRIVEQKTTNHNSGDHAHPRSIIHLDMEWVIREHKDSVWCVRFSPNGRLLCTCSSDNTAKVWDVRSHTLMRCFCAHSDTVWSCCFHPAMPESKVIATGSSDKSVKIWNLESGEVLHDLGGYSDAIDSMDFSSDGELLCTSCRNGVVKIWMNLSTAKRSEATSGSALECSVPQCLQPFCMALTAVNRIASRFCIFSNAFATTSVKLNQDSKSPSLPHNDTAATLCPNDTDLLSTIDPDELLFAGGPDNSISVWSVGDIVTAYKTTILCDSSQLDKSLPQSCDRRSSSKEHLLENGDAGAKNDKGMTESEYKRMATTFTHTNEGQELNNEGKGTQSTQSCSEQKVNARNSKDRFGVQLETITEEKRSILAQFDLVDHNITSSDEEESNSETTVKSTVSLESSVSEEAYSFYKVRPRWVVTDHRNTIWDCCTALVPNSKYLLSEADSSTLCEDSRMLISCSGDRTLR